MARKRISSQVRAHYRRIGSKGGKARAKALTQRQRSRIARMGAVATNAKKAENSGSNAA